MTAGIGAAIIPEILLENSGQQTDLHRWSFGYRDSFWMIKCITRKNYEKGAYGEELVRVVRSILNRLDPE